MKMDLTTNMLSTVDLLNHSNSYNTARGESGSQRIPALVYIITLTIIGTIGNSHVFYIYSLKNQSERRQPNKAKTNPYVVFVLSLAILDTFTSFMILPIEIADMAMNFTPLSERMCKGFRYIQFVIKISSALHIVLISIYYWRKVCYPTRKQINRSLAIRFCIFIDIFAVIYSLPAAFLAGYKTAVVDGTEGPFCVVGENNPDSLSPRIGVGVFFTSCLVCFVIICVSYVPLIMIRWKKAKPSVAISNSKKEERKAGKTTAILITLTALFVIAYTPFLILAILTVADKEFKKNLSEAGVAAQKLFIRSPLLNNVVNPFVYGFRDDYFRKMLLKKYPCMKRKPKSKTADPRGTIQLT